MTCSTSPSYLSPRSTQSATPPHFVDSYLEPTHVPNLTPPIRAPSVALSPPGARIYDRQTTEPAPTDSETCRSTADCPSSPALEHSPAFLEQGPDVDLQRVCTAGPAVAVPPSVTAPSRRLLPLDNRSPVVSSISTDFFFFFWFGVVDTPHSFFCPHPVQRNPTFAHVRRALLAGWRWRNTNFPGRAPDGSSPCDSARHPSGCFGAAALAGSVFRRLATARAKQTLCARVGFPALTQLGFNPVENPIRNIRPSVRRPGTAR